MKIKIGAFLLAAGFLLALIISQPVFAAKTNFESANMSGDTPYSGEYKCRISPEEKKKQDEAKLKKDGPGFWDVELDRSGFGAFGRSIKQRTKEFFFLPRRLAKGLNEQTKEYKAHKSTTPKVEKSSTKGTIIYQNPDYIK